MYKMGIFEGHRSGITRTRTRDFFILGLVFFLPDHYAILGRSFFEPRPELAKPMSLTAGI